MNWVTISYQLPWQPPEPLCWRHHDFPGSPYFCSPHLQWLSMEFRIKYKNFIMALRVYKIWLSHSQCGRVVKYLRFTVRSLYLPVVWPCKQLLISPCLSSLIFKMGKYSIYIIEFSSRLRELMHRKGLDQCWYIENLNISSSVLLQPLSKLSFNHSVWKIFT